MAFDYQINDVCHGFRIVSITKNEETAGRAIRMIHETTGAELLWLDNEAENMVFSISFRTLPTDSTGVYHILEHSVLCGSRKYPVREPFVELLKSSMNTFLNAMTFPDMTMYPVSSRNFRDLMNLTQVYLDAVFHPTAIEDPKRFCQEGWHISRDGNGEPEFRGIVYNEMKGAMSDPDTLIDRQIVRQLFPDTCYGHNSGGDPEKITDLSWQQFAEEYRKCYHPSNAYIYLDGGIDPDEMLETIGRSFDGFCLRKERPEFSYQKPTASEETIFYEISREEKLANRSHLTMARITGTWRDRADNLARSVICDVLTGSNEAPLKRDALDRKLCEDLAITVDDTGLQSWFSIHAENITDGQEKEISTLIEETGKRIAAEGLDRKAAEASLNRLAFSLREDDEPQGISRCIRVMGTWLYGGDPAESLMIQPLIREVRSMLDNGKIDQLAADMLLNRQHMAVLHTLPSHTAGEDKRQEEFTRLHRITDAWNLTEEKRNERLTEELRMWQNTPEPEELLKKLPMLTRSDADAAPKWTDTEEYDSDGVRIMIHRIPCNGVVYIRAYFPLSGYTLEELTKAALFAGMLGRLPTSLHDAFSLQQEIRLYTGSLGFAVMTRSREGDDRNCTPYLTAFVSALEEKAESALRLLNEVLTMTRINGQDDRIRDMMIQNEIGARQRVVNASHLIAVKSVLSRYSAEAAVRNALDGEPAIRYIHRFAVSPEDEMTDFMLTATRILKEGISRTHMIVSVTGTCNVNLQPLLDTIPARKQTALFPDYFTEYPAMLGFRIPAQTGFTARGYRLNRCGIRFSGITWLAGSILSLEYLWNKVRVQGGAYGAGFQTDRNGNIFSYSFRDPSPVKTLLADHGASEFLSAFARDEKNLDKYIISSLNELNPLLSPREKGAMADSRLMAGITRTEMERIRQEILNANGKDLIECAEWLDRFAEEGSVCVIGPQKMLNSIADMEIREI